MNRHNNYINIPTEILRTVAMIAEVGSFTKAGERLGLSQAGISAQIKRLQSLVGGAVFEKAAGGVILTERGKLIVPMAQRLLESNDSILALGGATKNSAPVRFGVVHPFSDRLVCSLDRFRNYDLHIRCDHSDDIARGLREGYLDAGCLFSPSREGLVLVEEWREELVWIKSKDFVHSPTSPIPLVGWPGLIADRIGMEALQKIGSPFRLVFTGYNQNNRLTAVEKGWGVMVALRKAVPDTVLVCNDYYLPSLPHLDVGICTRSHFDPSGMTDIIDLFRNFAKDI